MIENIAEFIDQAKTDHPYYTEGCLWIMTDKMEFIPFKLNPIQLELNRIRNEEMAKKKMVRLIILKARREGMSTLISSYAFKHAHLTNYTYGAIITHHKDATNRIFAITNRFYQHLDDNLPHEYREINPATKQPRATMKPKTKFSNRKELIFENVKRKWYSGIEVFTAGEEHSSRSGGYTFLHASEVAFMPDNEAMHSIRTSIKKFPGTEIYLESTANGIDGYFYNEYWNARNGKSDYRAVFFAWWQFPEYVMPLTTIRQKEELMESVENGKMMNEFGNEKVEMGLYNLSYEQLNWRRWIIRNECQNHPSLKPLEFFHQEYPSNENEAFVSTSGSVFKTELVMLNLKRCEPPLFRGDLRYTDLKQTKVEKYADPNGGLKIWHFPDYEPYTRRYVAGVDVQEGGGDTGDPNAIIVLDRLGNVAQKRVVATWHGYTESPSAMVRLLHQLALFYGNDIWYNPERSSQGVGVINELWKLYKNIVMDRELFKRHIRVHPDLLGTNMNIKTKPILVGNLNSAINEGYIECKDEEFWKECLTFVYGERHSRTVGGNRGIAMGAMKKGKQTKNRCFDDRVLSMCLTLFADQNLLPPQRSKANLPNWARQKKEVRGSWVSA